MRGWNIFKVAIGHSEEADSVDAIEDILKQCEAALENEKPVAGILYSAPEYDHKLILAQIYKKFPLLELIGSTSDGEFSSKHGVLFDSVCLILFCSSKIEIKAGLGKNISQDIYLATKEAVSMAKNKLKAEPLLCIATPTSITTSGYSIIQGLKEALGHDFPIFGGTSSASPEPPFNLYQFYKEEVFTDSVPVLLFSKPLLYSYGISSGWNPIGEKKRVTRAEKNIVYEIDQKPIMEYLEYYFGKHRDVYGEFLAVYDENEQDFYLRAPIIIDEQNKSITFAGDIPVGSLVQPAEANRNDILSAVKESLKAAKNNYTGSEPQLALIFSCSMRRILLGTRVKEEFTLFKEIFPENIQAFGFYTFGEICPFVDGTDTHYHNATFITVLMGEK